jgi:AcrR family transcriptional regulator
LSGERKRAYRSALRDEQARRTRRDIVAAAGELFAEDGFAATTIDAIAARAGVSRQTVFTSVGGKAALLKLAYDYALAGDDEPIPMIDRPAIQKINAEPDPYRALAMYAGFVTEMGGRVGKLYIALRSAAEVDPEAHELFWRWEAERLDILRTGPVPMLVRKNVLRTGLRPREAADVMAMLTSPSVYHHLVIRQGWSTARFRRWMTSTLLEQLLRPKPASP